MMAVLLIGIIVFCFSVVVYIAIRNIWVYHFRQNVNKKYGYDAWDALPSYDIMMFQFWMWTEYQYKVNVSEPL